MNNTNKTPSTFVDGVLFVYCWYYGYNRPCGAKSGADYDTYLCLKMQRILILRNSLCFACSKQRRPLIAGDNHIAYRTKNMVQLMLIIQCLCYFLLDQLNRNIFVIIHINQSHTIFVTKFFL